MDLFHPSFSDFTNESTINSTLLLPCFAENMTSSHTGTSENPHVFRVLKEVLVPIICVFGMVGNMLILLILTRKRLKSSCDGTERTVHIGLTALAVSDFLVCLLILPHGLFREEPFAYESRSFQLVYRAYSGGLINTFLLTSTWLTVTMASSRYLAICHPFRARHVIGMTGTKASIVLVFVICVVFNIPRMFENHIEALPCRSPGGDTSIIYFKNYGYLSHNTNARNVYMWVYFTLGIVLPLTVLAFCNICLVKALRESSKIRRRYRVPAAHVDSNYRITSILVTIVVMYILLVSPAEMLSFIHDKMYRDVSAAPALVIARELTNVLQTFNFSFNFVLYFVLNVHFRQTLKDLFCTWFGCARIRSGRDDRKARVPLNRQISIRQSTTHTIV